jgi:hypothetical protein
VKVYGKIDGPTIRRWMLLSMALTALWPGFLAYLDFFLDDRSAYEDDNELTALGLILSAMPFALFMMALGMLREARILASLMMPVVVVSILITSLPAWVDAYSLGLGASSYADVDYLEWDKIAVWVGVLVVSCIAVIGLESLATPALRFLYHFCRYAVARRI